MHERLNFSVDKYELLEQSEDSQICKVRMWIVSEGNNRHNMPITWDAISAAKSSLVGKPVLCKYNKSWHMFEGHEKDEVPVGVFLKNDEIYEEKLDGKRWLVADSYLWKKYFPHIISVLKDQDGETNISMEIELLDQDENTDTINLFSFQGVTMIGIEPAIPGAKASVLKFSEMVEETRKIVDEEFAITDFPVIGETKPILLKYSNYPEFDFEYAQKLKNENPEIWKKGGNVKGDASFDLWSKARSGSKNKNIAEWIKERESWAARHKYDKNISGVIACAKWGVVVAKGVDFMKQVIEQEINKDQKLSYFAGEKDDENLSEEMSMEEEKKVQVECSEEEKPEPEEKEEENKAMMSEEPEEKPEGECKEEMSVEEPKEEEKTEEKEEPEEDAEEKEEPKEEEMSNDVYLDVSAALAFLEVETEQYREMVGEQKFGALAGALFAKGQKLVEEKETLVQELTALKEFKANIEKEQVRFAIEATLKEAEDVLPKELQAAFREEGENCSIDNVDALKNKIKATAFSYTKDRKPGDDIVRIALPNAGGNKKSALWD